MKQRYALRTSVILLYTLQSNQPIQSVGPCVIVCLHGSLARARVCVLGNLCFVLRYGVAFSIIREVIISEPLLDSAESPEVVVVQLGGAL